MTNNSLSWVVVVIVVVVVVIIGVLFCQLIYLSQETVSDLTSAKGISRKITHLESSVLTYNKTQIIKQQMNNHETSYERHC